MLEILSIVQHEVYKYVSSIIKNNSNMHLIGFWHPQIILIVTSIYKGFEVKFIIFLAFSYQNYLLWLVTHIFVKLVFKIVLSLALLNSLELLKSKKKYKTNFFSISPIKNIIYISIVTPKFGSLSLVGGPRRWPKRPRPRAGPECRRGHKKTYHHQ